ncbi:MAG: NADPH:quinone oxidoreductase [Acidiferrobacteraceae bacterium]|nr:NADPH:quinone oxidoreductase [Acidiferrobacteraceae bacterium]|tara:strand:+ start:22102 stop:23091 length:990 start_codon:yes stop_codon:yes gene_type:complete
MLAVITNGFGSSDVLELGNIERPLPSDDQVLIHVKATSVNRPDIVQREGHYPPPKGESKIIGLEVAGTIIELGKNVDSFELGDRVAALVGGGGYAEFATAHWKHLIRIPDKMNFYEAACISETYITSYLNLFRVAGLQDGKRVLVHGGGGGVGTAAIQLCRALVPNARLFSTASAAKLQRVTELGADVVINYKKQDFVEKIKSDTEGLGVNIILDHVGASYFIPNLKALAVEGTLVVIGIIGGAKTEINLATILVKRQRIVGSVLRSRSIQQKAEIIAEFTKAVMPLFASREIKPIIYKVFALEDVREAHRVMESSSHFGKIVLQVSSS